MQKKINPYILAIAASSPFVLVAVSLILPTFDDWNTLSSPNYDSNFMKYLLPYGTTWRPGDAMFGYINAINSRLYPLINHIIIFLGHCSRIQDYGNSRNETYGKEYGNGVFLYLTMCLRNYIQLRRT